VFDCDEEAEQKSFSRCDSVGVGPRWKCCLVSTVPSRTRPLSWNRPLRDHLARVNSVIRGLLWRNCNRPPRTGRTNDLVSSYAKFCTDCFVGDIDRQFRRTVLVAGPF
jgi:hypothetical protein